MTRCSWLIFLGFTLIFAVAVAQQPNVQEPLDTKLPSGKSQREEILRADHQKSLKDAAELVKLSEALQIELEKNDRHVLSVSSLKKLEDIEKLTKRIRSRLKRF
jgi:hypothetical protein